MVSIRKAISYRRLERPYTRRSKFRAKSYIRANPASKIVRYDMGSANKSDQFPVQLFLKSKSNLQIRHNAIESARQVSNRVLEEKIGKGNYHLKIRIYPHHILRENPLASGAGADRMSTGMAASFGKPIGIAARVFKDQIIFQINTSKEHVTTAKIALNKARQKLPCQCLIEMVEKSKTAGKPVAMASA
ncbi:MAG: 50S ribosomal protein L16 [Candidatus Woesearchaeota archaeon]|nr:50S ribosomal protein L16 [Candidatus Woesearchaeota archaeon]